MSIRLVAFDLDGTLLDPNGHNPDAQGSLFRPAVREAVARCQSCGIQVTLATGRPEAFVRQRAIELGIDGPLIASHGTVVFETGGKILREAYLPLDFSQRLIELYAKDLEVAVYGRWNDGPLEVYLNRISRDWDFYLHLLGSELVLDASPTALTRFNRILKFVIFSGDKAARDLWQDWAGSEIQVARTHHELIEATVAGHDKGTALAWVAQHLGIACSQILAVGDQENDVPMFAVAGQSAAMGNAPTSVQAKADWVAPSFWEDGAVKALERFLGWTD